MYMQLDSIAIDMTIRRLRLPHDTLSYYTHTVHEIYKYVVAFANC